MHKFHPFSELKLATPLYVVGILLEIQLVSSLVHIDLSHSVVIHEVDKRFLSFNLDSYQLAIHWARVDLSNAKFINMTKHLTPAYLRVGGTFADSVYFDPVTPTNYDSMREEVTSRVEVEDCSTNARRRSKAPVHPTTIYGKDILRLSEFSKKVRTDLIYDLNVLQRNGTSWDPSNSLILMQFMTTHGVQVFGWELGNEPNHFRKRFKFTLSPKQLAADFSSLKNILEKFPDYKQSALIGPDSTRPTGLNSSSFKFLKKFVKSIDPEILSKVSIHQYFFDGRTATVNDFMNITIMNGLIEEIRETQQVLRNYSSKTSLWIGETSSGWGGGCRQVSDRFVESFLWLDKLGLAALHGVKAVFRQTLVQGWYGLINKNGDPTPDYFVSVLHKTLVGNKVIGNLVISRTHSRNITNDNSLPLYIRIYSQCSAQYHKAVVLFGINVGKHDHKIRIRGNPGHVIEEYLLQPPNDNLVSRYMNLNGIRLALNSESQLPNFPPVIRKHHFIIPKASIGFWVLPEAKLKICK